MIVALARVARGETGISQISQSQSANAVGVEGDSCNDFDLGLISSDDEAKAWYGEQWQPEGASYYGGKLILDSLQRLTMEQQMELLDNHPLFTGRCPNCEMPIASEGQVHWDCEYCGWVDDSV